MVGVDSNEAEDSFNENLTITIIEEKLDGKNDSQEPVEIRANASIKKD